MSDSSSRSGMDGLVAQRDARLTEVIGLRNRLQRKDHELHLIFDHLTRWLADKTDDGDMGLDTYEDIDPEVDMIRGMVRDCIDI